MGHKHIGVTTLHYKIT